MTNGEAIEIITNAIQTDKMTFEQDRALALVQKAVDKSIPKKVNISLKGTTGWNTKCHCPNCHSMVSHGKYCSNCGQALDFK